MKLKFQSDSLEPLEVTAYSQEITFWLASWHLRWNNEKQTIPELNIVKTIRIHYEKDAILSKQDKGER